MKGLWLCYADMAGYPYLPEEIDIAIQDAKNQQESDALWPNVRLDGITIYPLPWSYPMPPRPENSAGPAKPSFHTAADGVEIVGMDWGVAEERWLRRALGLPTDRLLGEYMQPFPTLLKRSTDPRPGKPHRAFIQKEEARKRRVRK